MADTGKIDRLWLNLQEWALRHLDRRGANTRRVPVTPPHLETGLRGERAALFELRRRGYVVVGRRWTSPKMRGDLDLIAWEGEQLCFVEVKTRTARDLTPAESAVDDDKRQTMRGLARIYLGTFPESERGSIRRRFDVVSVYLLEGNIEFELFQSAFSWS